MSLRIRIIASITKSIHWWNRRCVWNRTFYSAHKSHFILNWHSSIIRKSNWIQLKIYSHRIWIALIFHWLRCAARMSQTHQIIEMYIAYYKIILITSNRFNIFYFHFHELAYVYRFFCLLVYSYFVYFSMLHFK